MNDLSLPLRPERFEVSFQAISGLFHLAGGARLADAEGRGDLPGGAVTAHRLLKDLGLGLGHHLLEAQAVAIPLLVAAGENLIEGDVLPRGGDDDSLDGVN